MDWGAVIAGAVGGAGQAVGQLGDEQITQNNKKDYLAAQVQAEKDKETFAAQLKMQMANQDRQRIAGVYQGGTSAYDAANPQNPTTTSGDFARADRATAPDEAGGAVTPTGPLTPVNNRARMRAGMGALINSGDYASAGAIDKMMDSGQKSVANGNVLLNDDGSVAYDNSLSKQQSDLLRAQGAADRGTAALTRANGAGAPKALDQKQVNELVIQGEKMVDTRLHNMRNPFAMPGEDKETALDQARPGLVKDAVTSLITNGAAQGVIVNAGQALSAVNGVAAKADQLTMQQAQAAARQLFDGNKLKSGIDPTKTSDIPPQALVSPIAFMRWYREAPSDENGNSKLQANFNALWRQKQTQRGGAAPAADDGSEPAAAPTPAPAAAPPVQASAPSDSGADRYTGKNSYEQNKQSAADIANMRSRGDASDGPDEGVVKAAIKQDIANDPQLQSLYGQYKAALRDNRATAANNYLAQYNALLKSKYNG